MKKIVIIMSSLERTGPGFVVQSLSNNWESSKQAEISVITLSDTTKPIKLKDDISIYYLHQPHGKVKKEVVSVINSIIDKLKPDIIMSHGLRADAVNSKLKKVQNIKKISTSHNNPFEDYKQQFGIRGVLLAIFQMYTFNKLDIVFTLNPRLQTIHNLLLYHPKVVLIPNGSEKVAVDQYKRGQDVKYGSVATFNFRKNQTQILQQFIDNNNSKLVLWGEGQLLNELKMKYRRDNIIFAGQSSNKEKIFGSFDVFISASKSEGLPLSVLEAISAGKPLILSKIPAHEFITQKMDKRYYRLFTDNDELAKAIDYFNKNQNIVANAYNYLQQFFDSEFSLEKMAKKYIDTIEHI